MITRDEAIAWIAETLEEPAENVRATTRRDEIPGWDSLGVLSLMAELDERFDIRLTESDLAGIDSVQDVLDLLKRHDALSD